MQQSRRRPFGSRLASRESAHLAPRGWTGATALPPFPPRLHGGRPPGGSESAGASARPSSKAPARRVGAARATTIAATQRIHGHPHLRRPERPRSAAPPFLYGGRRPARAKPLPPEAAPQRPLAGPPFPAPPARPPPAGPPPLPPARAAQVPTGEPGAALALLPQGETCLPWVAGRRGPAGPCKALRAVLALRGVQRVTAPSPAVRPELRPFSPRCPSFRRGQGAGKNRPPNAAMRGITGPWFSLLLLFRSL